MRPNSFYTGTWHLETVASTPDAVYLRGAGSFHHILSLHRGAQPNRAQRDLQRGRRCRPGCHRRARDCRGRARSWPVRSRVEEPGGGTAVVVADPQGRILRFVHGDERHRGCCAASDAPSRITHVVFNSADVAVAQRFFEEALGFQPVRPYEASWRSCAATATTTASRWPTATPIR
jgi:catechol-2,3-dioxygenase